MGWISIIIIVVFVIYLIRKGHDEDVQTYVTNFGGMQEKYKILIEWLNSYGLTITKLTKDHVTLSGRSIYCIDDLRGVTHIRLYSSLPVIGKISKNWKFPSGYPQEKMIKEIENYLQFELQRMAQAGTKMVEDRLKNFTD